MQTKPHQPDYILFFTVIILTAVGVLTVYSASTVVALQGGMAASHYATRQFIAAAVGILFLAIFSRIPQRFWYRGSALFMLLSLVLLALVLSPGIGHSAYGGRRWIGTASVHLQPSETAIISTVIYLAFFFTKKVTVLNSFKRGLRPALISVSLNFILIMLEPDMGTAVTLLGTSLVVLIVSGTRLKPLLLLMGAIVPVIVGLALFSPHQYRLQRILSFLHPFAHTGGSAYQVTQGWTGIASGGWFGRGFDMSLEKTGFLPFPQTDFIFPVFVEEWGFIGGLTLLLTFAVLIWRGFSIARHASDRFGALLAVGLTSMITITTIINLGAVTGLLPVTGIPLPFISYGGTALIVNLGAMGILLNISRTTLQEEPEMDELPGNVEEDEVVPQPTRTPGPVTPLRTGKAQSRPALSRTNTQKAQIHQIKNVVPRRNQDWRARQEVAAGKDRKPIHSEKDKTRHANGAKLDKQPESGWRSRNRGASASQKSSFARRTATRTTPSRKDR